jgi:hypothetical protein
VIIDANLDLAWAARMDAVAVAVGVGGLHRLECLGRQVQRVLGALLRVLVDVLLP